MFWCLLWALVASVGVLGTWVSVNSLRFASNVARDARVLLATAPPPRLDVERLERLPVPVREYLRRALGEAPRPVQSVRFRHGGRFRAKLDGRWQSIRGQQYDTLNPPGFIWWGRLSAAPGLWIDARDRGIDGKGNMFVSFESSITLFDRVGRELDQGAMLRLLSCTPWFALVVGSVATSALLSAPSTGTAPASCSSAVFHSAARRSFGAPCGRCEIARSSWKTSSAASR
jgi:hypothetical protein